MSAILAEHPDLDAVLGSYGDAFVGAMRAYEAAGIPMDGLVTMHQSNDNPFLCAWKDAGGVTDSWTAIALLMEGRTGLTAAMMSLQGYEVPAKIMFGVQLKQVTDESCRSDIPPDGLAVEPRVGRAPDQDVPARLTVTDDIRGTGAAGAGTPSPIRTNPHLPTSRTRSQMTSTAGTGTEITDVVDAPTGDVRRPVRAGRHRSCR